MTTVQKTYILQFLPPANLRKLTRVEAQWVIFRKHVGRECFVLGEEQNSKVNDIGKTKLPKSPRFETLHQLNHLQIWHINLWVISQIEILLCIQNFLLEKVFADLSTVFLSNDHDCNVETAHQKLQRRTNTPF
ncbi:hypothetical protein MTR_1g053590 [Medicago truncatula]|uniref:Uncharacterized protein n=1 Tax=Medicago truncatula TaxID=3880 RepID=A0A072VI16_MEDTR|nr:hypothetical protein MTR_1g053590 [Medicago truncatula]